MRPQRTSKPSLRPQGFAEPTATIVWRVIAQSEHSPLECVTWNAFARHPYNPKKGLLSNRRPTLEELNAGLDVLKIVLETFHSAKFIALGRVA